jgi:hypothetical protein
MQTPAAKLLHPCRSPDEVKKHRVGRHPTRGGNAASAVGHHSRVRGDLQPTTQHASLSHARGLPTRRTAPCSGLVPEIVVEVEEGVPRPPRPRSSRKLTTVAQIHDVASPSHQMPPTSRKTEDVARAAFRRYTAPGVISRAENPATIRCGPSPHRKPLPKAPPFNDVLHRT